MVLNEPILVRDSFVMEFKGDRISRKESKKREAIYKKKRVEKLHIWLHWQESRMEESTSASVVKRPKIQKKAYKGGNTDSGAKRRQIGQ